ncbi:MAG: NTP transferase domain-containing protein [Oscillospiraceae bacterium]|jgi:CTP:phosphocholine cytidylyltransferase-like protein/thiamine kinase-like enzyme|nr:NTP transferase domain-containing protein [Oscillospiraceae bacterium]
MKNEHIVLVCRYLLSYPEATQREVASATMLSLGLVNNIISECQAKQYIKRCLLNDKKWIVNEKGLAFLGDYKVKNAIILAAGFGSRFVPLTYDVPKGLLEVYGQPMIERQIEHLHARSIRDITIVVGYKKEAFDYLIDKYDVTLVFNPEYATKNNLSSLHIIREKLGNTYVLMSDFWIRDNIFNIYEPYSWYSSIYAEGATNEWCVSLSASDKIKSISIGGQNSWVLIGPAYFDDTLSTFFRTKLDEYYNRPGTDDLYWEQILKDYIKTITMIANKQTDNVHEFENLEELRQFDTSYNTSSNSKIMKTIAKIFNVSEDKIHDIKPIKIGMTNHSFTFVHDNTKYIMRIPGEGTDLMIDRKQEYIVYKIIEPLGLCDNVIYIDPKTGYKITMFIDNARVCDPLNSTDVKACMKKLKDFHNMNLSVDHTFDIFERIEYYESLWLRDFSCFRDYNETKGNILSLQEYIKSLNTKWTLTHIDAVPDNFIFIENNKTTQIKLIDWEYSAMQDPHVDIAMFAVYSMYEKQHVDALIDSYFDDKCSDETRTKIYAYVAMCGLLWSNWCEYKSDFGIDFGEYSLWQYRYAKDYFNIVKQRLA